VISYCTTEPLFNSQRKKIAIIFLLVILATFWGLSRYPALNHEVHNAENGTLLERNFSPVSKDEILLSHGVESPLVAIAKASANWMETNVQGMTFGFFFGAACLLLLEQMLSLLRQVKKKGVFGSLLGSLFGFPLGVCTNCATPIGLGLKKAGGSNEAAFATLISSPSLNPLGLIIVSMLFPLHLFLLRLFGIISILLIIIPICCALFSQKSEDQADKSSALLSSTPERKESWRRSLQFCLRRYAYYLGFIVKHVLPVMFVVAILAGILVTFFPLEGLLFIKSSPMRLIMLAALLGMMLPSPMFVDIVVVWFLYSLGLPLYLSLVLLVTMPCLSLLVYFVMGREVGFTLTTAIFSGVYLVAVSMGLLTHHLYAESLPQQYQHYQSKAPFKHQALLPIIKPYSLDSFKEIMAGGVSLIDFDQDGLTDLFVARKGVPALFKNIGGAKFVDTTKALSIDGEYVSTAGIWGDYDNDGLPDLYLVNYQNEQGEAEPNLFFKNLGNGRFREISQKVGLTHRDKSSSAAWADYDNDGDLDLFVANFGEIKHTAQNELSGQSSQDRLYRNENGIFKEVALEAGVAGLTVNTNQLISILDNQKVGSRGFSFQPVWFDFNNDHLVDLFVSSDLGSSQLYKNLGNGRFENVTKKSGLARFGTSMGVAITDLNSDGFWDLFVTTAESNHLWINQGNETFKNEASTLGMGDNFHIGWGVAEIDFSNSGENAIVIANGLIKQTKTKPLANERAMDKIYSSNSFFIKGEGRQYENKVKLLGLENHATSRGLAVADLNQDGALDIAISERDKHHLSLYLNKANPENHYILIKLRGKDKSNYFGVGAKVTIRQQGKVQQKLLQGGASFASQNPFSLHFGLGKNPIIDEVIIEWPNGHKQVLSKVEGNQSLLIKYDA
jgi:uncharacterized membrane protein YraQ (UPF0718 family)